MAISLGSIGPGQSGEAQRRVDPAAFGVGIGRAIGGMAESLTNFSNSQAVVDEAKQGLSLAFQGRQDKTDRSLADIGLINVQAGLQRDLAKLQDTLPLGAPGYTEQAQKLTDAAFKGYLAGVPERIREEYAPRAAAAGTNLVDGAFNFQLNAQDNAFRLTTTDIAQSAIDSIASGEHDLSYWRPIIQKSFENSTLDAAETAQLYEKVMAGIEASDLKRVATDFALNPASGVGHSGGPEDGSDVVAAGLPGEYRGILNIIARDESNGAYTIMNGGAHFTSFADHPGPGREGHSSAAGRYQFIYSTWKSAQRALGLPDFSPESQDRAAVWLAEQDYKTRTGRNLQADLQSGDHALIEGVRKSLAGNGNQNVTWKALQGVSSEDFFAAVTGQEGTMSSLLTSPEYSNLTYAERQGAITDAQSFAAQLTAQKAAAGNARIESMMTQFQTMAVQGNPNTRSLLESVGPNGDGSFPADKYVAAQTFIEGQEQSRKDANIFATTMSGQTNYDPTDAKQTSAYAAMYQKDWQSALASGDQETFTNRILPFVAKTNAIPAGMQSQLASLSTSANPKIADFALQAILALKDRAPTAFAQLSKDSQDAALFYRYNQGSMPQDQLLATVRNMNDPALEPQRKMNQQAGNSFMTSKDNIGKFSAESLAAAVIGDAEWGRETPATNIQQVGASLQSEVITEFMHQMSFYSDPGKAYSAAVEQVQKNWGRTGVGASGELMRRPPEKAYPNMDPAQMQIQLTADFFTQPGESVRLVSDQRTEQDIAAGRPASYSVIRTGTDGSILPIMMDQSGAPRPAAARMYFDPNYRTAAQQLNLDTAVETQNAFRNPANAPFQPDAQNYVQDPTQGPAGPNLPSPPPEPYTAVPPGANPALTQKFNRLKGDLNFAQMLLQKQPKSTVAKRVLDETEAALKNFKWD